MPCIGLLAVLLLLAAVLPGQVNADATPDLNAAGLVVDYGDGRTTYAIVMFAEDSLSGSELLHRSGLDVLSVEFGGMGEGICEIEDVGCDDSSCRSRLCQTGDPDSPFWQFAEQSGDGVWVLAPLGASSTTVTDGSVNGWFWRGDPPPQHAPSLDVIASETGTDLDNVPYEGDQIRVVTIGDEPSTSGAPAGLGIIGGISILAGVALVGGLIVSSARARAAR